MKTHEDVFWVHVFRAMHDPLVHRGLAIITDAGGGEANVMLT